MHVRPVGVEAETDRLTVSVLEPATVMVEVPEVPTFAKAGREAEIVKVATVKVIVLVVWVNDPLVPVTVAE